MKSNLRLNMNRGFSLIELMIGIAIAAIVLALAIPSFTSIIQNNLSVSTTNDLVGSLNYARSEAIRRGSNVSVCPTTDQTFSSCGTNWANGWIVFLNPTGSNAISTSTVLRTQAISGSSATITTAPSLSVATYGSNGFAAAGTNSTTFTVKATGCTADYGRSIAISVTGRLTVSNVSCP